MLTIHCGGISQKKLYSATKCCCTQSNNNLTVFLNEIQISWKNELHLLWIIYDDFMNTLRIIPCYLRGNIFVK